MPDLPTPSASSALDALCLEKQAAAPKIVRKAWEPVRKVLAKGVVAFDNTRLGQMLEKNPDITKSVIMGGLSGGIGGATTSGMDAYEEAKKKGEKKLPATLRGARSGFLPGVGVGAAFGLVDEVSRNKDSAIALGELLRKGKRADETLDALCLEKQGTSYVGAAVNSFRNIGKMLKGPALPKVVKTKQVASRPGSIIGKPGNRPINNLTAIPQASVPPKPAVNPMTLPPTGPLGRDPKTGLLKQIPEVQPVTPPTAPVPENTVANPKKKKPFLTRGQVTLGITGLGVGTGVGLGIGAFKSQNQNNDQQRMASAILDELFLEKQGTETVSNEIPPRVQQIAAAIPDAALYEAIKQVAVEEAKRVNRRVAAQTRSFLPDGLAHGVLKPQRKLAGDFEADFGLVEKVAEEKIALATDFHDSISLVGEYDDQLHQAEEEIEQLFEITAADGRRCAARKGMKVPSKAEAEKEKEVTPEEEEEADEIADKADEAEEET